MGSDNEYSSVATDIKSFIHDLLINPRKLTLIYDFLAIQKNSTDSQKDFSSVLNCILIANLHVLLYHKNKLIFIDTT